MKDFEVPVSPGKTRFHDFDLPENLMHAIADLNFQYCTPVQALSLPKALQGKDVAAKAQTGTGKTAAFLITALAHFHKNPAPVSRQPGAPRMLVLVPTRELAVQVFKDAKDLGRYTPVQAMAVYGGMDHEKQEKRLAEPCDILIATPGRLLDFSRNRVVDLRQVEIFVIDEADRMLDMGFIPDVRKIIYRLSRKQRQTMLFSATLSPTVMRLAESWMVKPVIIETEPEKATVDTIKQQVYSVAKKDKLALALHILRQPRVHRVLIFCNRRDTVDKLTRQLYAYGIDCDQLSGDVPQRRRLSILDRFRAGQLKVLVATDVAGRGIHVDDITHVINYDLPEEAEDYVHRIGRTGRAGAEGVAIAFACEAGAFNLMEIEKFIGCCLACEQPPEAWRQLPEPPAKSGSQSPWVNRKNPAARQRPRQNRGTAIKRKRPRRG